MMGTMGNDRGEGDTLSRWLSGEGSTTLDRITGEALDYLLVLDRDLTVRYISRMDRGVPREDVVGRGLLELLRPDSRETARTAYANVLRTGTPTRFESVYKDSDE